VPVPGGGAETAEADGIGSIATVAVGFPCV